jgi:dipeptidyl aminopeptidase/acylaminoacyl peptidase
MTKLIPLHVLFGNPERAMAHISPDGTKVAFLAPDEGVLNVWVSEIGSSDAKPVTKDRGRGIQTYRWAYDGRHILFNIDKGGDENWRINTVDLQTGEIVDSTPFDGVQAQIIGASDRKPDQVLVGLNKDDPRYHDVYRLTLSTGELTKEISNPGFAVWLVDRDLVVRAAEKPREDGGVEYVRRDGDEWVTVRTVGPDDYVINVTHSVGFTSDGRLLLVSNQGSDTGRLVSMDLSSGDLTDVASDREYDVFTVGFGRAAFDESHNPRAVPVMRDRLDYIVLDESIEADLAVIRAACRGDAWLAGRDDADARWLVNDVADNASARTLLYDRGSKSITVLFETQPALSDYELASVEPFSFTSRDALTVHGYATFPVGVERRKLPCVLHVHGGPWGARHLWGYQPINQWLANRGYVCLEIDYRGSGGYGKAFLNASAREWAGRMHDDLIDGLEFAIAQGWIDRERMGIFGGSYGGYAALVGATFTPDVFKCAIDYVGPSNLITLLESIPPYWFAVAKQFAKLLGDPVKDRDFLWERSPLRLVDQIKIPVLIAQGANDPRVKQAESEQIVAALKEHGLPYEYLLFSDEGHGFVRPENREKFHLASERFLAEHLGGRTQGAEALAGAVDGT